LFTALKIAEMTLSGYTRSSLTTWYDTGHMILEQSTILSISDHFHDIWTYWPEFTQVSHPSCI